MHTSPYAAPPKNIGQIPGFAHKLRSPPHDRKTHDAADKAHDLSAEQRARLDIADQHFSNHLARRGKRLERAGKGEQSHNSDAGPAVMTEELDICRKQLRKRHRHVQQAGADEHRPEEWKLESFFCRITRLFNNLVALLVFRCDGKSVTVFIDRHTIRKRSAFFGECAWMNSRMQGMVPMAIAAPKMR